MTRIRPRSTALLCAALALPLVALVWTIAHIRSTHADDNDLDPRHLRLAHRRHHRIRRLENLSRRNPPLGQTRRRSRRHLLRQISRSPRHTENFSIRRRWRPPRHDLAARRRRPHQNRPRHQNAARRSQRRVDAHPRNGPPVVSVSRRRASLDGGRPRHLRRAHRPHSSRPDARHPDVDRPRPRYAQRRSQLRRKRPR